MYDVCTQEHSLKRFGAHSLGGLLPEYGILHELRRWILVFNFGHVRNHVLQANEARLGMSSFPVAVSERGCEWL